MESFKTSLHELRGDALARNNEKVDAFRTEFHRLMKQSGWMRKTSIQSAMYEWVYTKAGRVMSIDGWHGTGTRGTNRFWGPTKTFFSLYVRGDGFREVIKGRIEGDSLQELSDNQDSCMAAALAYIRNL